uniref:Disintegrin domain-containing protein n=1 Tax=Enterobius vermicularis TaxID=51028 RepID=A0A0N4UWR1_ENTVE
MLVYQGFTLLCIFAAVLALPRKDLSCEFLRRHCLPKQSWLVNKPDNYDANLDSTFRGGNSLEDDYTSEEAVTKPLPGKPTSNVSSTTADSVSSLEDDDGPLVCDTNSVCFSDSDCFGGKCVGLGVNRCACLSCVSGSICSATYGCGGLKDACNLATSVCDCEKAFKRYGYKSYGDALNDLCNIRYCVPDTDSCFGMPCNPGTCDISRICRNIWSSLLVYGVQVLSQTVAEDPVSVQAFFGNRLEMKGLQISRAEYKDAAHSKLKKISNFVILHGQELLLGSAQSIDYTFLALQSHLCLSKQHM